jgi:hypothetical protein
VKREPHALPRPGASRPLHRGNGPTAFKDGHIVPELHTTATDMTPDATIMRINDKNGNAMKLKITRDGVDIEADASVLRPHPTRQGAYQWEPVQ